MIRHYRKKEGRKIGVEKGHTGFIPKMLSHVDMHCDSARLGACHSYLSASGELREILLAALWLSCVPVSVAKPWEVWPPLGID